MQTYHLKIGTCSWKYDSWRGIIYPEKRPFNYLQEYSRHFRTVEIDQWFWSLFNNDKAVLPKPAVVQEYADSVPDDFQFCIKIPNSITLTHYYKKKKSDPLVQNPHFLSVDLMNRFLQRLEPLSENMGPLIFQFEYLNKQKVPGGLQQFIEWFEPFAEQLQGKYKFCIETRNPNYLNSTYFNFLNGSGLYHVFLQGYYMPSIFEIYRKYSAQIEGYTVIRLHGADRKGIEKQTGKEWDQVVQSKDKDLDQLAVMIADLKSMDVQSFLYVNNHFEGSAPKTITRIKKRL